MTTRAIFTVNAGSSSLKSAGYALPSLERIFAGHVRNVGRDDCRLDAAAGDDQVAETIAPPTQAEALARSVATFRRLLPEHEIAACSHRVVHGGPHFDQPMRLDADGLAVLDSLTPLAPLHQPHNLAAVRAMIDTAPDAVQVACFDTAFHRGHPKAAEMYALPAEIAAAGVRRYGFHGLSYEFIAYRLKEIDPALAAGEVVVAHLGSGASLCAIGDGKSVDSTMGFTALDGLPMATRCGQLDPGVVLHLIRNGRSVDEVETLLYRESGLKGLSGLTGDMRALTASDDPAAAFAVDYFCYRVAREIGALAVSLNGLDGVVFTAGIGENQPEIRANVSRRLASLGVAVDEAANRAGADRFDAPESRVKLLRIDTDEELMLARHAAAFVRSSSSLI